MIKKEDSLLDKNHKHFTERELKYLNYNFSTEIIKAKEVIETTLKVTKIDEIDITEAMVKILNSLKKKLKPLKKFLKKNKLLQSLLIHQITIFKTKKY